MKKHLNIGAFFIYFIHIKGVMYNKKEFVLRYIFIYLMDRFFILN